MQQQQQQQQQHQQQPPANQPPVSEPQPPAPIPAEHQVAALTKRQMNLLWLEKHLELL